VVHHTVHWDGRGLNSRWAGQQQRCGEGSWIQGEGAWGEGFFEARGHIPDLAGGSREQLEGHPYIYVVWAAAVCTGKEAGADHGMQVLESMWVKPKQPLSYADQQRHHTVWGVGTGTVMSRGCFFFYNQGRHAQAAIIFAEQHDCMTHGNSFGTSVASSMGWRSVPQHWASSRGAAVGGTAGYVMNKGFWCVWGGGSGGLLVCCQYSAKTNGRFQGVGMYWQIAEGSGGQQCSVQCRRHCCRGSRGRSLPAVSLLLLLLLPGATLCLGPSGGSASCEATIVTAPSVLPSVG
jgi:hypothetical protein